MMNTKNIVRNVIAGIVVTLTVSTATVNERGIVGKQAPSWSVDQWLNLPPGKQKIDVQDYHGKTLYMFCFQSWCPGCHRSGFPTLQKVISRFRDNDNVAFVAIQTVFEGYASNTFEHAKQVARKYKLTIPVGQSGENGTRSKVMTHYRSGGTPWVVIIDRDGVVRYNDFHIGVEEADKIIHTLLKSPPTKDNVNSSMSLP